MSAPSTLTKPWLTQPQQSGRALLWHRVQVAEGDGTWQYRRVGVGLRCHWQSESLLLPTDRPSPRRPSLSQRVLPSYMPPAHLIS